MILIPFFYKHTNEWTILHVFLREGGTSLWSVDAKESLKNIKMMLKDNGLPVVNLIEKNATLYARIDAEKLNLDDFYMWNDVNLGSDFDVWRTFQIPVALWSCPVFKYEYCKSAYVPECVSYLFNSPFGMRSPVSIE